MEKLKCRYSGTRRENSVQGLSAAVFALNPPFVVCSLVSLWSLGSVRFGGSFAKGFARALSSGCKKTILLGRIASYL